MKVLSAAQLCWLVCGEFRRWNYFSVSTRLLSSFQFALFCRLSHIFSTRGSQQLSATETRKTTDDILWTNQIKNIFGVNFSISFSPAAAANSNAPLSHNTHLLSSQPKLHMNEENSAHCRESFFEFLSLIFFLLALTSQQTLRKLFSVSPHSFPLTFMTY